MEGNVQHRTARATEYADFLQQQEARMNRYRTWDKRGIREQGHIPLDMALFIAAALDAADNEDWARAWKLMGVVCVRFSATELEAYAPLLVGLVGWAHLYHPSFQHRRFQNV